MQRIYRFFMKHPVAIALLWLVPAVYLGYRVREFKMEASTDSLLLESDPDLAFYDESRVVFGSDEYVIVSFSRPDVFAPEVVSLVSNLTAEFSAITGVDKVLSITNVRLLRNLMDEVNLLMLAAMPEMKLTTQGCNIRRAREELIKHAVWGENLVSADGKTTSLIVFFRVDANKGELERRIKEMKEQKKAGSDVKAELEQLVDEYNAFEDARKEVRVQIVHEMRKVLAKYDEAQSGLLAQGGERASPLPLGEGTLHFYTSGLPIIVVDMVTYLERDLVVFGAGVLLFVMLSLFVVFRRVRWVVLSIVSCLVLVAMVLGLMVVFGNRPTIVTGNLSSLLFIVAMAHPIHMVVRFSERTAQTPQGHFHETMALTAGDLALPCFYTATTTIAGFASLCIGDLRPVIEFGLFMSLGVALSLLVAFSLFPAGLAILKPPRPEGRRQKAEGSGQKAEGSRQK
ncbi:MAG: MMPL family transporter, partial [Planctomycetota bacterium]|nr:MMPL family transporter [Planctomycetota bacterium]